LITDNSVAAQSVLESAGYHCKVQDVVVAKLARNRPDEVAQHGMRLLSAGIGILYSHLSSSRNGAARFAAFKTTDNRQAVHILAHQPVNPLPLPAQPFGQSSSTQSAA
jgi:hypothetical protein